jgi:trimeric autotransporter adhesin
MKRKLTLTPLALLALSILNPPLSSCLAQGTAFTYQGRLNDGASPAGGIYDLRFAIYDLAGGGVQQGNWLTNSATVVSNGLFTVTLDFGNQFPGAARWIEVAVRTNGGGAFTALSPRQALAPAPYAITAGNIVSGGIPSGTYGSLVIFSNDANSFNGAFNGNGGGLTNLNAFTLGGLGAGQFWQTTGNSNTVGGVNFIGTLDHQPLELWSGRLRVLRLEPDTRGDIAGNLIGGSTNNAIEQPGSGGDVIGGGGYLYGPNLIRSNSSGVFIGAGSANQIGPNVNDSFIGAGFGNVVQSPDAAIGGGNNNRIQTNSAYAVIAGGAWNTAQGTTATVGGGYLNSVNGYAATIPGGYVNEATGDYSFSAGQAAHAVHKGAFVWSDASSSSFFYSGSSNQFSVRASGGVRLVTGGAGLTVDGQPVATTNAALLNASQTFSGVNTFNNAVGVNGSLSVNTLAPATTLTVAGDIAMSGGSAAYHNLSLNGGNSAGFLYGSFAALGDGIHLGYNYYADSAGGPHIPNTGGSTSRISAGYGQIILAVGGANAAPSGVRLDANLGGVTVFGTFNNFSDRNGKQDFAPVSPAQILDGVLQLPVSEWSYKTDAATRHIGPMAQDFYSVFNIGTDDKHIAPIDEGGIALAAIQGLNQKLTDELKQKETEMTELRQEVQELKSAVTRLTRKLEGAGR